MLGGDTLGVMGRRNNIMAGAFVLAGVLLAVWVSFLLAGRGPMAGSRRFTVRFTLSQGAMGLKNGSALLLAGQQVGQVTQVRFDQVDNDAAKGLPLHVDVLVEMRRDLGLFENAAIHLEKPLLGNMSSLNIVSIGDPKTVAAPQHGGPTLDDGDIVLGRVAPPAFLADAGFGPEQADQIRSSISAAQAGIKQVTEMIDRLGPKLESGAEDGRVLIADLRTNMADWSKRIGAASANIETASARLTPLLESVEQGVAEGRQAIRDINATVVDIRAAVSDNRGRIDNVIKDLESLTGKLDRDSVRLLNEALADGRESLRTFADAIGRISGVVGEQTPNLRRTLSNLRLMSDQLKLTAVEVRSQPWRLLHRPTTKELESQVLYDATRSYAEAASDLRAASESLETVAAGKPAASVTDLESLTQRVREALSSYRQAERYLLDKLVEESEKK